MSLLQIAPANKRLFDIERAIEDNEIRMRALLASVDRICMPLNLAKLQNKSAPDHAACMRMARDVVSSYQACRVTDRRLQREYERLWQQSNTQSLR